jgi:hypothetical protein
MNRQWVIEELGEESKNSWSIKNEKHNIPEPLGYSKDSTKSKVYSNEHLHQENRSYINSLMMHLKLLEKQEQVKPQISMWIEIVKIRVELMK